MGPEKLADPRFAASRKLVHDQQRMIESPATDPHPRAKLLGEGFVPAAESNTAESKNALDQP
jgi:hypothetical protein